MDGNGKTPLKNAILLSYISLIQIKKVKHFKNLCIVLGLYEFGYTKFFFLSQNQLEK